MFYFSVKIISTLCTLFLIIYLQVPTYSEILYFYRVGLLFNFIMIVSWNGFVTLALSAWLCYPVLVFPKLYCECILVYLFFSCWRIIIFGMWNFPDRLQRSVVFEIILRLCVLSAWRFYTLLHWKTALKGQY